MQLQYKYKKAHRDNIKETIFLKTGTLCAKPQQYTKKRENKM